MQSKRELKRIDWNMVRRLVVLLNHNCGIKKTKIAMKSGMSYDKCILYLDWMEMIGLIERKVDEYRFQRISLSQHGSELYEKYFREPVSDFSRKDLAIITGTQL